MNIANNALSAKNVRMHGMASARWTTKDKITQYKGLVNLYRRDKQITDVDTAVATKRRLKGLLSLRKDIETDRKKLDNAMRGDKQRLRNVLADHRELQLTYQNSEPKKVIEDVHQVNFTRRKLLDKLQYQLKLKSQEVIDLKLEEALLQDRLKYEVYDQIKEEKVAQIITGKVQDALLKKEAALAIKQTYTQIIDIMKKDTLYFDGILLAIQNDYWYQCRCVLNATRQGQLATEYKYDRELEFKQLEAAVLSDMKTQKEDLENVREQAEGLFSNLKQLVRRDSDVTTCITALEESRDFTSFRRDLELINSTLNSLKNTTLVSSFEAIYPSLQEQVRQKKRLENLVRKCERNRDIMLNKVNHAQVMSNLLETRMVETTGDYKKKKKNLLEGIAETLENKKKLDHLRDLKYKLVAKVRIMLRQLQQLCKTVKTSNEPVEKPDQPEDDKVDNVNDVQAQAPEEDEIDGRKIIAEIRPKLQYLVSVISEKLDISNSDIAYKTYEDMMLDRQIGLEIQKTASQDSLLAGFSAEDAHILSREDIKKRSTEIVAAAKQEDEIVPIFPSKKKRKKF